MPHPHGYASSSTVAYPTISRRQRQRRRQRGRQLLATGTTDGPFVPALREFRGVRIHVEARFTSEALASLAHIQIKSLAPRDYNATVAVSSGASDIRIGEITPSVEYQLLVGIPVGTNPTDLNDGVASFQDSGDINVALNTKQVPVSVESVKSPQLASLCASNPCGNGATCSETAAEQIAANVSGSMLILNSDGAAGVSLGLPASQPIGSDNSFTCTCQGPWTGLQCDVSIGACATDADCSANGDIQARCVLPAAGASSNPSTCSCSVGWTGKSCEHYSGDCATAEDCQTSGDSAAVCLGQTPLRTCSCSRGREGFQCEIRRGDCRFTSDCNEFDAEASCVESGFPAGPVSGGGLQCECSRRWYGTHS